MSGNNKHISVRMSLTDAKKVFKEFNTLGETGQRALAKIEKQSRPASKGLLALNNVAGELRSGMSSMAGQLGVVGSGLSSLGSRGLLAAAGLGSLVVGLRRAVMGAAVAIENFSRLADTAEKLGITTSQLQELRFAAEQNGVTAQKLDMGWQRFTRRLGEAAQGTGALKNILEQYNISATNADGTNRDAVSVYRELANVVSQTTSETERLRIANNAFDSEGVDLVRLMALGAAGFDKYAAAARNAGIVIDQHIIHKTREVGDEINRLNQQIQTNMDQTSVFFDSWILRLTKVKMTLSQTLNSIVSFFKSDEQKSLKDFQKELDHIRSRLNIKKMFPPAVLEVVGVKSVESEMKRLQEITKNINRIKKLNSQASTGQVANVVTGSGDEVLKRSKPKESKRNQSTFDADKILLSLNQRLREQQKYLDAVENSYLTATNNKIALIEKEKQAELSKIKTLKIFGERATVARIQIEKTAAIEIEKIKKQEVARLESIEKARLRMSRESVDGIKRAFIDLQDASSDMASHWESNIKGMNQTVRSVFVDITTGAQSMVDGLGVIFNDLQRQVSGNIYDKFVGNLFDKLIKTDVEVKHTGGIVGEGVQQRSVNPLVFTRAPRFHSGGIVPGLRSQEVPIIALKGERVLTEAQQENTAQTILALAAAPRSPNINLTVNNNAGRVSHAEAHINHGTNNTLDLQVFVEEIENTISRNVLNGTGLAPVLENRYNLNSAHSARR